MSRLAHTQLSRIGRLSLALGVVTVWGCGAELIAEPETCRIKLDTLIEAPAGAAVYDDTTLAPAEGVVIDHMPRVRGEHPVERFWFDEAECAAVGGWYAWGPPAPIPKGASLPLAAYGGGDSLERLRVLAMTTPDSGAEQDATWWRSFAIAADASFAHAHLHSTEQALSRLDDLCTGVDGRHSVIVALAGVASAAGDGALVLPRQALSFRQIVTHTLESCRDAGLIGLVIDTSFAPDAALMETRGQGLVYWRASTGTHPFAGRASDLGGGALSSLLTDAWSGGIAPFCRLQGVWQPQLLFELLTSTQTIETELLRRQVMASSPTSPHTAAQGVASRLPSAPLLSRPPVPTRMCTIDADCFALETTCKPGECHTMACENGRCVAIIAQGQSCDDASLCTEQDSCDEQGLCRGQLIVCNDDNPCTSDGCEFDSGCVFAAANEYAPCDDDALCTLNDRCREGECVGLPVICDDDDPCTDDRCDEEEGCTVSLNTATCDDQNPCTGPDFCQGGFCRGSPLSCDDGNPCTQDSCEDGLCLSESVPNGLPCDDEDECTSQDRCIDGQCEGIASACDDGLECTLDQCADGVCVHLPEPGSCLGPQGCIPVGDHPSERPCMICASTDNLVVDENLEGLPCPDDGLACTEDVCQNGQCTHFNTPETCLSSDGECVGAGENIAPCLICLGGGVALAKGVGEPCNDGQSCTLSDTCQLDGACRGTPRPCCQESALALACGEIAVADSSDSIATEEDPIWSCLPYAYGGAHQLHVFESPCDGMVTFNLDGSPGQLLIAIKSTPGSPDDTFERCEASSCDAYSTGPLPLFAYVGQRFLLAVDALPGYEGPYTLQANCDCQQPAP